MKDSSRTTAGLPDNFVSADDEGLFAFVNTLRASVRAKVAAEQQHGASLADIVVQVREMVRVAAEEAHHPKTFPSRAFPAIARQAVAWCLEAYRPLVPPRENDLPVRPSEPDSQKMLAAKAFAVKEPTRPR